ncbi:MAG TPA: GNAT family N-acetyltransferase [Candidatus Polarisedimenticolia bacterium]|nr:GNAT family N-acetyltransferase [Candidatus Polarisedimenticolia bacterium]
MSKGGPPRAAGAPRRPVRVVCRPLTRRLWPDLERLFGDKGACGGCWCMVWRLPRPEYERGKGAGNKAALRSLAGRRPAPGVLAFHRREPVGWCAIAPRADYPALGRSRVLAPLDDRPVWSVSCFFVARPYRRRGVGSQLLAAAVAFAASCGARHVEGYPVEAASGAVPDVFAWTGTPGVFLKAGFREAARRSPTRPIMRREVRPPRQKTQA